MENTVVQTTSGRIEGVIENGLRVFKGVPYAAPPLGDLRWKPPQPHPAWTGIRPATSFAKTSLQPTPPGPSEIPGFGEPEESDEDCLYLNIWTPGLDSRKRPVMVWIHGGAFIMGSGSQTAFRSGNLSLRGDVVTVSLNYRLGLLGFLNLDLVTEGRIPSSGNEALLDQLAAIRWIKANIASFGGDPDNLTLFGESAGSMSIACLMAMPAAAGLFQKVIMESGTASVAMEPAQAAGVARDFLSRAGWDGDVSKLQALPSSKILEIQTELTLKAPGGITPVAPVIDGRILPAPLKTVQAGSQPGVKTLIGSNLDEYTLFEMMEPPGLQMTEEMLAIALGRLFELSHVSPLVEAYRRGLARRGGVVKPADIFSAIRTDRMFRIPSIRFLEARTANREEAYAYLFTWQSPLLNGKLKACHALELGFVFGNPDPQFCGSGPSVEKLSSSIQQAWINFARTGDPGHAGLGDWPVYGEKRYTMILGADSRIEADPYSEERQIWNAIGEG